MIDTKRVLIAINDNDFVCAWDWIGKVALTTRQEVNFCGEHSLLNRVDFENFIYSLIPTAIEFLQYRADDSESDNDYHCRYRDISKEELNRLSGYLRDVRFKYNFDESDNDYIFGGSETLIIDFENNLSYIH